MLLKSQPEVNSKKITGGLPYRSYRLFRRYRRCILLVILICLSAQPLIAEGYFTYLDRLHGEAVSKGLHREKTWLYLLHYYPAAPNSRSDITDPRFFLSDSGSKDPKDELYETLEAIFDPVFEKGNRHGQCLFRSRFFWLDSHLKFDRRHLPKVECRSYHTWRKLISAQSISLVFASSFMDNPGSVYGHTFLKINQEKGGTRLNLLDHVIQYQALPEDQIGILYAIKGIFGGYRGLYPLDPYYIPIQNNIEFEDRSIWEYELNLSDYEMELLLTHSWELAHFYTDYYFFKENCAYRILELIEIAAPRYRFKDRFWFWAMPSQAVVYALNEEGLISRFNYFPARTRQLMQKFESLAGAERKMVYALLTNPGLLESQSFKDLSEDQQIRILDTALDYLRSRINKNRDKPENATTRRKVLLARARLGKSAPVTGKLSEEQSIHLGHAPARLQAAAGNRGGRAFFEVGIRPSYHDLLADETGHLRNSHFTTLDIRVRRYEEEWTLHEVEVVQLFDLAPNNIISNDWSWQLKIGSYPSTASDCLRCRKSQVRMGGGKSRLLFAGTVTAWLMAHGSVEADNQYEKEALLGAGLDAGVLLQITDSWRMLMQLSGTASIAGEDHDYASANLRQRWKLGQHQDLRLTWHYQSEHEVRLAWSWYF